MTRAPHQYTRLPIIVSLAYRRMHSVLKTARRSPGGVTETEVVVERKQKRRTAYRGKCRNYEAIARSGRPLRAPDPPLESEDASIHLHRAQRHSHSRSSA